MRPVPKEAGKSSFDLLEEERLFGALPLEGVGFALDLGCGAGNYALPLAKRLAPAGRVLGVDLWAEGIAAMEKRAAIEGVANLKGFVGDLSGLAPVEEGSVDLALMATVLHDLVERRETGAVLKELDRVLTPSGVLAVVEFRKTDDPPGPPRRVRLSPEETAALLAPAGFALMGTTDLGSHLYLSLFRR